MRPPLHLVDLVEVEGDFFAARREGFERPGRFVGVDFFGKGTLKNGDNVSYVSRMYNLWNGSLGFSGGGGVSYKCTSIIAVCPLIATFSFFLLMMTSKSRPLRFPATGTVMSTSPIVCDHL